MKLTYRFLGGAMVLAAMAFSVEDDRIKIAHDNNAFAFDFYHHVTQQENGNIFFSPNSISTALAMTYGGADGTNAEEMQKALHFGPNNISFHDQYGAYLKMLHQHAEGNIQLRIANQLWGENNYEFNQDYLNLIKEAYHAPLKKVDFEGAPDSQRSAINNWVEQKTENKIKDLLPAGSITSDTRLVLANAIYFKGDWLYQFKEKDTKEKDFHLSNGQTVTTPFMNFKGTLGYYENDLFKMVRMPYKGEKQSMIVVLPHETQQMEKVESAINTSYFRKVKYASGLEVILAMPKFKLEKSLGLNGFLESLGMKQAFNAGANFSKMTPSNDLYISTAVHKAFIEIDEKGTEAAAATVIVLGIESVEPSSPPPPKEFIADHPFLFYIIDNESQAILFMGRLMNP